MTERGQISMEDAVDERDQTTATDSPNESTNPNATDLGAGDANHPPAPIQPLREDGPTIEEYVRAGYAAGRYPPNGYKGRESPGLDIYLQDGEAAFEAYLVSKAPDAAQQHMESPKGKTGYSFDK